MDDATPIGGKRITRRQAPPDVWDRVREDFLSGVPAQECCRRHGVGRSALFLRAGRGGWRRMDQPWIAPGALDADDEGLALMEEVGGDIDRIGPGDLIDVAVRRMVRAALRGDAAGALRWRRVRQILDAEDDRLERIARGRRILAEEKAREAARKAKADCPDGPDSFLLSPESPA